MGIKYVISKKRNDVIIAKKYIKNYILGLVVIFCLIMIAPILIDGIKALL